MEESKITEIEKGETSEKNSQEHAHHFTKNSYWQAKQSIADTTVAPCWRL
jgi:hypothetical protein